MLVLGANGAVGSAAVQLATSIGAKALRGMRGGEGDVDTSNLETLAKHPAEIDVVIDTIGIPALTSAAAKKLTTRGRLVFISAPREGGTELGIEMVDFYRNEKTLVGVNSLLYDVEEFVDEMKRMSVLFEEGLLVAAKEGEWSEVRLEEGVEGYERAGKRGGGKVVLVMG